MTNFITNLTISIFDDSNLGEIETSIDHLLRNAIDDKKRKIGETLTKKALKYLDDIYGGRDNVGKLEIKLTNNSEVLSVSNGNWAYYYSTEDILQKAELFDIYTLTFIKDKKRKFVDRVIPLMEKVIKDGILYNEHGEPFLEEWNISNFVQQNFREYNSLKETVSGYFKNTYGVGGGSASDRIMEKIEKQKGLLFRG